jgi:hypothetical protein
MSKSKNSPEPELLPVVAEPVPNYSEQTLREMDAGREAARRNGAAQENAEAARAIEAAAKLAQEAQEKRQQAEEKMRVVAEAEAAHAAKVSASAESSV